MKIEHISISRESTWKECEKKYHYRYHLGIIPVNEPIYFLYGKVVHKIIEVYNNSKGKKNINEITNSVLSGDILLEEAGKKVTAPLPQEYRQKLPNHLVSFLKLTKVMGFEGRVEWKFEYDLDPPHKRFLTGVIDRITLGTNKCLIVDYKTTKQGRYRKTKATIGSDLQLQCYAKVAQREFGYKADQITCALYHLDGAEFLPTQFSQNTLDNVDKRLLEVYKTIENSDPNNVKGTVGNHCYRCEYNKICPFFFRT